MTKVRIVSPGWATFTGSMGHGAMFKDGESVEPLTMRQIARIGSSVQIVDVETGLQVGPSSVHLNLQMAPSEVAEPLVTKEVEDRTAAFDAEKLAAEEAARKAADEVALEAARAKAAADAAATVYTRTELEAVASNDGIEGLRVIATPLGVKGRGIVELVNEILAAQAKIAAA